MEETWTSRDLPVLTAAVELYEEQVPGRDEVGRREIAEQTGLTDDDVDRAMIALVHEGYLDWRTNPGDDRIASWRLTGVSGAARRLVGQWPSPERLVEQMIAALLQAAEAEPDPDRKTRLKAAAQALGSFAKDLVTNVAANLIAGGMT